MSTAVTLTNRSAYGLSAATGSMTMVLARIWAMRGAIGALQPRCEGLGAQDKVSDRPEEIRAVSLMLSRLEHQGVSARCD